jgi:hypothetical protein
MGIDSACFGDYRGARLRVAVMARIAHECTRATEAKLGGGGNSRSLTKPETPVCIFEYPLSYL